MMPWLFILIMLPVCLQAAILHVALDGSQPYTIIQTAVNASAQNDTILVHPGTYIENIEINQRSLTLASLEMITGDSTYIAQTIINGNETGSCIRLIECDSVIIRGLYLTNGNGSLSTGGDYKQGGGIYSRYSLIRIYNCKIMYNNNAFGGAGCSFQSSQVYLSGTTIAYNHATCTGGGVISWGISETYSSSLVFDSINRCSVYLNTSVWGNDFELNLSSNPQIFLDKFTVPYSANDINEFIYTEIETQYTLDYNTPVIIPQYADLYVNPSGNDNNSGLSLEQPLKSIALALIKIKADSLHPQIIHLANGNYSNSLNGQLFPLNLKSYVTIQGESECGTILDGDNIYEAFGGYNSEQEAKIGNLTMQHFAMAPLGGQSIIKCISRIRDTSGNLILLSMELENITIRDCHPIYQDKHFGLISITYPQRLLLKNISIDNCTGFQAIQLEGSNIIGENIRIRNFHYAPGNENSGTAMALSQGNFYYSNRPNVFTNLEITNCHNNNTEWGVSSALKISSCYAYTSENTFINTTIADNVCSPNIGSAVLLGSYTKVNFINSIISNNYPYNIRLYHSGYTEPVTLRLKNTLLSSCPTGLGNIDDDNPTHNITEYLGANLDTIPDFTNNPGNPYYLAQTSPCIDAGTTDFSMFTLPTDFVFPALDLAGNPRIYGSQVDMGAYEWNGTANPDENETSLPYDLNLNIAPNPFQNNTVLKYSLDKASSVFIEIYNSKGQRVKKLVNAPQSKGKQTVIWDGMNETGKPCSTGLYYCKLTALGKTHIKKMLLIK